MSLSPVLQDILDTYSAYLRAARYASSTQSSYLRIVRTFLVTLGPTADVEAITHPTMQAYVTAILIEAEDSADRYHQLRVQGKADKQAQAQCNTECRRIYRRLKTTVTAFRSFGEFLQGAGYRLSNPALALEPIEADDALATPERRERHASQMKYYSEHSVMDSLLGASRE
jgi:hypothetical protein